MAAKRSYVKTVKPCGNCGIPVSRPQSNRSKEFFCSQRCYHSSKYRSDYMRDFMQERAPERVATTCPQCGTEFKLPPSKATGSNYCSKKCMHTHRLREQVTSGGYIRIFVGIGYPGAAKSGHMMQHRKVMQDILGRPLLPEENVHHKNGDRADNRPENLELWTTSQPSGQRVVDKVQWAKEILALYADTPMEE